LAGMLEAVKWHFFIAHAGGDEGPAGELYDLLSPKSKVFLDSRCLNPGDDWDRELQSAHRSSLVTVVLISAAVDEAHYLREEIAGAVDMARKNNHRVVPVYLDEAAASQPVPYGLRVKHGLHLQKLGSLEKVAEKLLELLSRLLSNQERMHEIVASQEEALVKITAGTGKERAEGIGTILSFSRHLVSVLIGVAAVALILIVAGLTTSLFGENRELAVTTLGSIAALTFASAMFVFSKYLSIAQSLVQGEAR
jgi:hypothetical protein